MSLLFRIAVFVPVIFLVMIVYKGQHEPDVPAVLRAAGRATAKTVLWTGVTVAAMLALEFLFLP